LNSWQDKLIDFSYTEKYNEETLEPLPLNLPEGKKEVIWHFQDESSFHANDQEKEVFLLPHEQLLRQKGSGRLVHVSDLINMKTGRLVLSEDKIAELKAAGKWTARLEKYGGDARKIIYPGKNYDPWWDMNQLIDQVCF
jgi:hypothetical protein